MIRLLFIGDVFGSPGRRCLEVLLPDLRRRWQADLVVVNGENAAGGLGLNHRQASEMFLQGVDVITTGNHVWKQRDLLPLLDSEPHLLRPANYPQGSPGQGWVRARTRSGVEVGVVNLEGRTFMSSLDCPFATLEAILAGPLKGLAVVCVDMHAEATSEKQALAWHFDGQVSAVLGTHTHVQTADERLLPRGTAFITDLGMTGPQESVIGMEPAAAISRFLSQRPQKFQVAKKDPWLHGALVTVDEVSGRAVGIQRVREQLG
ncbi:MAG: TIGR00282 family metallophosphoesterase [Desulfarculus sp.]|nr:TIGR00282 family metallophosphoesterase [Desulfarculus sp.]